MADDGLGGFFSNFWLDSEPSTAPSSGVPLEESLDFNSFVSNPPLEEDSSLQETALDASYSLLETGLTGQGEEVDVAVASGSKLQATSLNNPGDIQALLRSIENEKIPAVQAEMARQLKAASEDAELTPAQAIAAAILQVAPIIIGGAMAGKSGAAIGAKAGGVGGVGLVKGVEQQAERGRERAKAEAQLKAQELKDLQGQAFNLQRDEAKNEFTAEQKRLDRETKLDVANKKGGASGKSFLNSKVPAPIKTQVLASTGTATIGEIAAKKIDQFPSEGVIDWAQFRVNKELAATQEGRAYATARAFVRQFLAATEGKRPTDFDAKAYEEFVLGDFSASPATVSLMIRNAVEVMERQNLAIAKATRTLGSLEDPNLDEFISNLETKLSSGSFSDAQEEMELLAYSNTAPLLSSSPNQQMPSSNFKPGNQFQLGNYKIKVK